MAVVITDYIKRNQQARLTAKANIRYIESRPGKDHAKITRALFSEEGALTRKQAYSLIEDAAKGSVFYRMVINLDAFKEDTHKDLHLRQMTEKTMQKIAEILKQDITWIAAIHDDHTSLRHVHALAILPRILNKQEIKALRLAATEAARSQRQQLDLSHGLSLGRSTRLSHHKQPIARGRLKRSKLPTRQRGVGGLAPLRPQMCTCPLCGLRQPKPYLENTPHCTRCGSEIRLEKTISLQSKYPFRQERQEEWELGFDEQPDRKCT